MSEQQQVELDNALAAVHREQVGAERYRRSQRDSRGGLQSRGLNGPLQFDESGFPIPQATPSFAARVARLIKR